MVASDTDSFTSVFGTARGRYLTVAPDPLPIMERLCAAAASLGEDALASFTPLTPVPARTACATIYAMGERGDDLVAACEKLVGTYAGLDSERHRRAVAALCDAAYAHIARPHLSAEHYEAQIGPARELLGPRAD